MTISEYPDVLAQALAQAVSEEFYTYAYGSLPAGTSASAHYATVGWREGCDPNPWFSTRSYLAQHPDVAAAGLVPLFHFLERGHTEGRHIAPSEHSAGFYARDGAGELVRGGSTTAPAGAPNVGPAALDDALLAEQRRAIEAEFDATYYLQVYQDVARAGVDPLVHFLQQGWREGRNPSAFFSTRGYLEAHVDVAQADVNPLYHYAVAGRREGRIVRVDAGFRYEILASQTTLTQRLARTPKSVEVDADDAGRLRRALDTLSRSDVARLHVSVSHDDFTTNLGGLQVCLFREAAALKRRSIDHIHLFPARSILVTNHEDPNPVTGVLVNSELAGYFDAGTIAQVLGSAWLAPSSRRTFAIHSLLGHNVSALAEILRSAGLERGFFWIHDFSGVCAGHTLMRNDVEFCGAPAAESLACGLCLYGERRRLQVADHEYFFRQFEITVMAPSEVALKLWKYASALPSQSEIVHPHCTLVESTLSVDRTGPRRTRAPSALKVGFLGSPQVHKGWPLFRELVLRFAGDNRYEFSHLGQCPEPGLPVEFFEVSVDKVNPMAMVSAVQDANIDVVLVWSLWPETFCFVAHEAIAGGAVVVTSTSSGNVTHAVAETGKGIVVESEEELRNLFEDGSIRELARAERVVEHFSLEFSEMTADFIEAERP